MRAGSVRMLTNATLANMRELAVLLSASLGRVEEETDEPTTAAKLVFCDSLLHTLAFAGILAAALAGPFSGGQANKGSGVGKANADVVALGSTKAKREKGVTK